ncbi:site-2 protease family protein [Candidatus Similichlamydia epinepheli]|uniref:site-2 protease family protein n=1 Tax=Candidatus Similichlamydia epinepheli TaxID=1903953 RepID=UPI0013009006|nr:site-2 protease family protein [Candidatus Similichlamydia epinepheli]
MEGAAISFFSKALQLGFSIFSIFFLVLLHELGHYIAAKMLGIPVQCFSVGIGPPIISRTWNGEKWQIGCIPFGGVVQIDSISPFAEEGKEKLPRIAIWRRALLVFAGPFANFFLSLFFFSVLWTSGGLYKSFRELNPFIGTICEDSDLKKLGLGSGDRIISYGSSPVRFFYDHFSSGSRQSYVDVKALSIGYQGSESEKLEGTIKSLPWSNGVQNYGVSAPGSFVVYQEPFHSNSPLVSSGMEPLDRIVWLNGSFIFCFENFEELLSRDSALLRVRTSSGEIKWKNSPRLQLVDLMDGSVKRANQLRDLLFSREIPSSPSTWWIPCVLSEDLRVTEYFLPVENNGLEIGDKILSVQGVEVSSIADCRKELQERKIFVIVHRDKELDFNLEDSIKDFEMPFHDKRLHNLIQSFKPESDIGPFFFLRPIEMKRRKDIYPEQMATLRKLLSKINFGSLQEGVYPSLVKAREDQLVIGGLFADRSVYWKVSPFTLFNNELWKSLNLLSDLFLKWKKPKMVGPIGLVKHLYGEIGEGTTNFLYFIGAISLQLGLFNLLPIPVLDGGHLLFLLIEACTGKSLPPAIMKKVFIGFFLLFLSLLSVRSILDLISILF